MAKRNVETPLFWAVLYNDLPAVQKAIEDGENVDALDRDGRTPLFQAVVNDNIAIAAQLLRAGANANARDTRLETPLHFAAREYNLSLAELLLKSGAQVDAQDSHGNTPLFRAAFDSRGRGELINLLLAHGADRSLKNRHGVSPEDLARKIANYDVAQFFPGS